MGVDSQCQLPATLHLRKRHNKHCADKFLAWPGRKQARKHVRDTRDFNIETQAVIKFFFFPVRQGAEGNLRHSDRNISFFSFLVGLRTYQHPCIGVCVGRRAGLDGCKKTPPTRDSIPGPSSPGSKKVAYEKIQLYINSRGALHKYVKISRVKLFYTSRSAAQPPACNDKSEENVIMINGWFC